MFKTLRVPERFFRIGTWFVSGLFAMFLIGFGGLVIKDLPKIETPLEVEAYADQGALAAARGRQQSVEAALGALLLERDAVKTVVQSPAEGNQAAVAEQRFAAINAALLMRGSELRDAREAEQRILQAAASRFNRAANWQQLRVFVWRLAVTLPLLVASWWLATRKRGSDYWLLYRGFITFAIFTFFVELVPYLPSYGGYVRYGVGVVLTAVLGHYTIRGMRGYLAKRHVEEQRTEPERRRAISADSALKKMDANVCPGCERPIMGGDARPDFCVHCGLRLFESCVTCAVRKNVFFQFCAKCGTPGGTAQAA